MTGCGLSQNHANKHTIMAKRERVKNHMICIPIYTVFLSFISISRITTKYYSQLLK